jgi:CDGSH iron-sulfur domain-containing protein 3
MKKRNNPYIVIEEAGTKRYCACGKTKTPPHCDESHLCGDFKPYEEEIDTLKTVAICGCGKSRKMPYCDGSHECHQQL